MMLAYLNDNEFFLPDDVNACFQLRHNLQLSLVLIVHKDDAHVRELVNQLVQHAPGHALDLVLLQLGPGPLQRCPLIHLA